MLRLILAVVAVIAVLGGVCADLGLAQYKYEPRIEGVSEYEIAEWQAYYRRGPFVPGAWVPMYAVPAMPPPWVRPTPATRGRPAPCKEPLW